MTRDEALGGQLITVARHAGDARGATLFDLVLEVAFPAGGAEAVAAREGREMVAGLVGRAHVAEEVVGGAGEELGDGGVRRPLVHRGDPLLLHGGGRLGRSPQVAVQVHLDLGGGGLDTSGQDGVHRLLQKPVRVCPAQTLMRDEFGVVVVVGSAALAAAAVTSAAAHIKV